MGKTTKNRRNKVSLVFDEDKRREFLTGFHKRKVQRKKDAKDKLERDLKSERKRLKLEAKESYKKLIVSHRPIPELEQFLLKDQYEDDDVTVTIQELSANQIALDNNFIGANQPTTDETPEALNNTSEENEIPGMSLKEKKSTRTFKDEREVKKLLKKEATKKVKKSKVFQKINQIERTKQRKKSQYKRKINEKVRKKH